MKLKQVEQPCIKNFKTRNWNAGGISIKKSVPIHRLNSWVSERTAWFYKHIGDIYPSVYTTTEPMELSYLDTNIIIGDIHGTYEQKREAFNFRI